MTIQEMHYDFKMKLDKVDSQGNRNLLIPEIDWALNEALSIFITNSVSPRVRSNLGFEKSQRNIDDVYPLVEKDKVIQMSKNLAALPEDYMFFISAEVLTSKNSCYNIPARLIIQRQGDRFEDSPFTKSSFEWREVNGIFIDKGILTFTDGTFTNDHLVLSYVRKHPYICFPSGFGEYELPDGTLLSKDTHCILPEHTHREIVDIAVALVAAELGLQETSLKFQKLQLTQFTNA